MVKLFSGVRSLLHWDIIRICKNFTSLLRDGGGEFDHISHGHIFLHTFPEIVLL